MDATAEDGLLDRDASQSEDDSKRLSAARATIALISQRRAESIQLAHEIGGDWHQRAHDLFLYTRHEPAETMTPL